MFVKSRLWVVFVGLFLFESHLSMLCARSHAVPLMDPSLSMLTRSRLSGEHVAVRKYVIVQLDSKGIKTSASRWKIFAELEDMGFVLEALPFVYRGSTYIPGSIEPKREKEIQKIKGVVAISENTTARGTIRDWRCTYAKRPWISLHLTIKCGVSIKDVVSGLDGIMRIIQLSPNTTDPDVETSYLLIVTTFDSMNIQERLEKSPLVEYIHGSTRRRLHRSKKFFEEVDVTDRINQISPHGAEKSESACP